MSKLTVGKLTRFACTLGSIAIAVGAGVTPSQAAIPAPQAMHQTVTVPQKQITTQSVGIQMFMWPWVSLQSECTYVLGPEHVDWIMVSPPQEDIQGTQWWTHYQPVSYSLNSQLGTEQQFKDMVSACNDAGVQVIVDAVINHMTGKTSGLGFDNTSFTKYNYPGLYGPTDFHAGLASSDPNNYCSTQISDYSSVFQVTHCELLGLADLATEKQTVRQTIADYLNSLIDMGVAGFRIDAAKHIGLDDLTAIHNMLTPVNGNSPYFVQESIGSSGYNAAWTANGDVFAWDYQSLFPTMFSGQIGYGKPSANVSQLVGAPDKTVIMVSNHDTERSFGTLTYNDFKKYQAASEFLLADARGKPMLYTGYAFFDQNPDAGPPSNSSGFYLPAKCLSGAKGASQQRAYDDGTFICMERWTGIKGMVQWHHEVATSPVANAATAGKLLSFTRGTGFFALNGNEISVKKPLTKTVNTGLTKGIYCDVVSGGAAAKAKGKCLGTKVTVDSKGKATITLGSMVALALDATNKLR